MEAGAFARIFSKALLMEAENGGLKANHERNVMKLLAKYQLRHHTHTTHCILFKDNPSTYINIYNIYIQKHTYMYMHVYIYLPI